MDKQIKPEKVFEAYNAEVGNLSNQIVLLKAHQIELQEEIETWTSQVHSMTQENNDLQLHIETLQHQIDELNQSFEGELSNDNI